ncbi:hypothetical protein TRFO_05561 [Tritrichomonas foetus]|uniref:Uncharacterized protein n=1 Tax=Tritrichomonas foetus TaxID=1144522 RepID=A0A1J4K597_9EUKA|nr:hypothetical protein TRFO_05561 [Tritrichomonas foetus]|eukprot:OHT06371.1 hypothetical protein TRFO_05561 [Tritrichomonas foetus]
MQKSITKTYESSVEPARNSILSQKSNLEKAISTITELHNRQLVLKNDLINHKTQMDAIIDKNRSFHDDFKKKEAELETARQRLFIFQTLAEINSLKNEIKQNYQRKISSIVENMKKLYEKTQKLTLNNLYNEIFTQCQSFYKNNMNIFINSNESSFSFNGFTEKLITLQYFELLDEFKEYFWNYINKIFVVKISQSKCTISFHNDAITINSEPNGTITSPEFINTSTKLLKIIIQKFKELKFELNDKDLEDYAHNSMEIGLTLFGGKPDALNQATSELCKLAKIENVNIVDIMKDARLPLVLDRCRSLLVENRPFAEVVKEMRKIMEGTSTEGILKKIAAMATVIWREDKTKIELAIPSLVSIGTKEALECIMMFDEVLKQ